jgi:hypothetical protein
MKLCCYSIDLNDVLRITNVNLVKVVTDSSTLKRSPPLMPNLFALKDGNRGFRTMLAYLAVLVDAH